MASYVYGNVAPKHVDEPRKKEKQVRVRKKTPEMNKRYVVFLAVAAMVALLACVQYLQLQSEITERSKHITALQQELADAKEENTTRYNIIMNEMNLEEIREIAIRDFGMVYAEPYQIIKYQSPDDHSVTKYAGIPESGVVASSDSVE